MPTDTQIDNAAAFLAQVVCRHSWHNMQDGSAREHGFDPWWNGGVTSNARRENYRDVVRQLFKIMTNTHRRATIKKSPVP